jgi:hypothetical protein
VRSGVAALALAVGTATATAAVTAANAARGLRRDMLGRASSGWTAGAAVLSIFDRVLC